MDQVADGPVVREPIHVTCPECQARPGKRCQPMRGYERSPLTHAARTRRVEESNAELRRHHERRAR